MGNCSSEQVHSLIVPAMTSSAASSPSALKRTPLFETHVACGARMVDFGGWEMPVNYGSQVDEHHKVRNHAGMFDVSHMLNVDVMGNGVRDFLSVLVANNIDKLQAPGKALYSCMLNEAGGVIDDLIIYFIAESHFRIVVNAGTAEKDVAWMQKIAAARGFNLTITPRRDLAMIAVQGPQAREIVWKIWPHVKAQTESLVPFSAHLNGDVMVARTGYTGEDGFEIVLPAEDAPQFWNQLKDAGVAPAGLGARDTLRLEAGMNLYGNDMAESVSPLAWTVDMKVPRDFIGRAALERDGKTQAFVGLKLLDRGVLRSHMKVVTPHGEGEVTSGTHSPTCGFSIAMARVPVGVAVGDSVQVDIRGKLQNALVVKMPFARNGKALVS
jgi:aminomethyltransferase